MGYWEYYRHQFQRSNNGSRWNWYLGFHPTRRLHWVFSQQQSGCVNWWWFGYIELQYNKRERHWLWWECIRHYRSNRISFCNDVQGTCWHTLFRQHRYPQTIALIRMIYKGDFGRLFLWRLLHCTRRTVLARYIEKRYFEFGRGRGSCLEITLISEKPLFEWTNVLNCSLCSRASRAKECNKACILLRSLLRAFSFHKSSSELAFVQ